MLFPRKVLAGPRRLVFAILLIGTGRGSFSLPVRISLRRAEPFQHQRQPFTDELLVEFARKQALTRREFALEISHEAAIDRPGLVQAAEIVIQLLYFGLGGVRLTQELGLPLFENPALIGDLKSVLDKPPDHRPHPEKLLIAESDSLFKTCEVQISNAVLKLSLWPLWLFPDPGKRPRALLCKGGTRHQCDDWEDHAKALHC